MMYSCDFLEGLEKSFISIHAKQSSTSSKLERLSASLEHRKNILASDYRKQPIVRHYPKRGFSLISQRKIRSSLRLQRLEIIITKVTNVLTRLKKSSIESHKVKEHVSFSKQSNFYSLEIFEELFGNLFDSPEESKEFKETIGNLKTEFRLVTEV